MRELQKYACEAYSFSVRLSRKPIAFQEHSLASYLWIPDILSWSLFLFRNTLHKSFSFLEILSWKLLLNFLNTLMETMSFQNTLQKCLPKSLRNYFCNIYQMVRNRATNMKAKVYFWPGRQNLCLHIIQQTVKFMILHAPPAVIIYKIILLSDCQNL